MAYEEIIGNMLTQYAVSFSCEVMIAIHFDFDPKHIATNDNTHCVYYSIINPSGNNIFQLWKRKILFPATFKWFH